MVQPLGESRQTDAGSLCFRIDNRRQRLCLFWSDVRLEQQAIGHLIQRASDPIARQASGRTARMAALQFGKAGSIPVAGRLRHGNVVSGLVTDVPDGRTVCSQEPKRS